MIYFDEVDWGTSCVGDQKQRDTISYLLDKFRSETTVKGDYVRTVSGGICYMLSMEWLRLIISEAQPLEKSYKTEGKIPDWKTEFGMKSHVEKNAAYYMQIMNNFYAYASKEMFTVGDKKKSFLEMLEEKDPSNVDCETHFVQLCMNHHSLSVQPVREWRRCNIRDWEIEMAERIMSGGQYMFVRLIWLDGERMVGHRMAAYRESDTQLYFYDPNMGVIGIRGENEENLETKIAVVINYLRNIYSAHNGMGIVYSIQGTV